MAEKDVKVLLLTGYLGSGKTTLLNRILNNRKGIRFAVIVNDIGEVNIDAELIQQGGIVGKKDDSLVALQNGCICCTLKMDLVEQIRDIMAMKHFDYIVIEASGVCEPAPIAQTICSIPTMGVEFVKDGIARLDNIVTVVDALRMRDEFNSGSSLVSDNIDEEDIENLLIQQIEFCNMILLNKVAEVTPSELARIKEIIRALQPKAKIVETNFCDVDLDRIINTGLFNFEEVATSATWIREVEGIHDEDEDEDEHEHHHEHGEDCDCEECRHEHHHDDDDDDDDDDEHEHHHHHHDHDHDHHHHHHHHHDGEGEADEYGIGTFVYYQRRPIDINKFDNFVAKHWPKGIIRTKGICYFSDQYDECFVFEQAGKQMSLRGAGKWYACMPKEELEQMMFMEPSLKANWDPFFGDRMQKLVFIGQHLDKEAITAALDACLA
ncbi:MAG: GTP-binding protein [Bacteroidales bacterium]|nr:GTP-binding protein [Bacteroidales bacterium]